MRVTITSIKLKSPLKFFLLSTKAMKIVQQLKASKYRAFKKRGFWTTHYTMTLWNDEAEMKAFTLSGAHLEAMKTSKEIASEIRTLTIDATSLPKWKEAKVLLQQGKVIKY